VDKVCSMVLYKPCTMTILTCTSNLPKLKKLLLSQGGYLITRFQQNELSLKSGLYSHLYTLETNVSPAPKFMKICTSVDHDIRSNFSFRSGVSSKPRLILKNRQSSLMVHTIPEFDKLRI
jgi:hypothetical protein